MTANVRLAILQPTSLCNLNCTYCYVPDRMNSALMTEDVLRHSARFIFDALPVDQSQVVILWHAGEPLAAGLDFYRWAFDVIAEEQPTDVSVRYSFQTNATLVTEAWCDFFDQHEVSIGVSIDGPSHLHDANRVSWSGMGSHRRAMRGVGILREHGYDPPAICVLTPESIRQPDEIYEFFLENAFPSVGFNVEESEGVHERSRHLDTSPLALRADYVRFMRRIWLRRRQDGNRLRIREFERELSIIEQLRTDRDFVAVPDEVVPFVNIIIRRDGAISTFAPELASTPSEEYNNFILGNVLTHTPQGVLSSDPFLRLVRDIDAGRDACRTSCAYFPTCGGGYQSNRYVEHGSMLATRTSTCELHRQALTDVVLSELETLSKN